MNPAPRLVSLHAVVALAMLGLGRAAGLDWPWTLALVVAGIVAFRAGLKLDQGARAPAAATPADSQDTTRRVLADALPSVIEVIDLPAFALGSDGRVLAHNARARDLFPNLTTGRQLFQVSRNPDLLKAVQVAATGSTAKSLEMADPAPRGRRMLASVSPLPLPASHAATSPTPAGPLLLIQLRDLTEEDRLAELRSDFVANASHELRTPLASIKGFIETLQGPASGDAAARQRFLAIMETQAARMTRILDDLLSLSRIEMREHLPPESVIDVREIVQAAVDGQEPIAREAQIALSLSAEPGTYACLGDPDEIEQVVQNLIHNAIKYGNAGGRVVVTLKLLPDASRPTGIAVAVADDGPGIAEEHLPRLTERFYRVDTQTSRERGGTGLGLAIVKHIVNRHRGEIKIASKPGQGSTFTVILPALAARQSGVAPGPFSDPNRTPDGLLRDFND